MIMPQSIYPSKYLSLSIHLSYSLSTILFQRPLVQSIEISSTFLSGIVSLNRLLLHNNRRVVHPRSKPSQLIPTTCPQSSPLHPCAFQASRCRKNIHTSIKQEPLLMRRQRMHSGCIVIIMSHIQQIVSEQNHPQ